ncbi:MAG: tetratricopeptide (TPR) repeat protein [Candidatus Krumholzibacteriia bacterium]|jgi:tetratricopeptide (TPR) repeat protein
MNSIGVYKRAGWLFAFLLVVLMATTVVAETTWQAPKGWGEYGSVRQWKDADAKFYRSVENAYTADESMFNFKQVEVYEKTRRYTGSLEGVGMSVWLEMSADEQADRRRLAQRELSYFGDLRNRILDHVQNTRNGFYAAIGNRVGDRTIVGDGLGKLRTAVALDPSDPYAWHLYSYFAGMVGDYSRALRAISGAEMALAEVPADQLMSVRIEVSLDKAWLLRDRGDFVQAQAALDEAIAYGSRGNETQLLQGLLAAQSGDYATATQMAGAVLSAEVLGYTQSISGASFQPDTANLDAWPKKKSRYLHDWITALSWLHQGRPDMARAAMGEYAYNDQRPFGGRFWNDATKIYEVTRRPGLASRASQMATSYTMYRPYLVYNDYASTLENLTGRRGWLLFSLGFDSFLMNGSRIAFGAAMVDQLAAATSEDEKQMLAGRALEQLEICERIGIYAGQASVLQGQVYYLMGDLPSAQIEVAEAMKQMVANNDVAGLTVLARSLTKPAAELSTQDVANFYGQSGSSQGRWRAEVDPAASLKNLQATYAADGSDENRRELARVMIRQGDLAGGRELLAVDYWPATIGEMDPADLELMLEADRAEGVTAVAVAMVTSLQADDTDPWRRTSVWAMVGFICLDSNLQAEGKAALKHASLLDPGNTGLKVQLGKM